MRTWIRKEVASKIKKRNIDLDFCSPEYVASIAYNSGLELTSDEVVYISDNIEKLT